MLTARRKPKSGVGFAGDGWWWNSWAVLWQLTLVACRLSAFRFPFSILHSPGTSPPSIPNFDTYFTIWKHIWLSDISLIILFYFPGLVAGDTGTSRPCSL
jgi:hypothetical protein